MNNHVVWILSSILLLSSDPYLPQSEQIIRNADGRAVMKWLGRHAGYGASQVEHDGKSWRQRESQYSFRVIGLRPDDYIQSAMHSVYPKELDKYALDSIDQLRSRSKSAVQSSEEWHYAISRCAEVLADRETMGPLACRMTAVFMKNVAGYGGAVGSPAEVAKDQHPRPMELYMHFEFIDPEKAARHIKEIEEREKELPK